MACTVVVASQNPVKIEAARHGFESLFPEESFTFTGVSVASGVPDQPMTSDETYQGAYNRAENAAAAWPGADYSIGIEGGIEINTYGELEVFAWVVVRKQDAIGRAKTAVFYLPEEVAVLVRDGMELGHADDAVFGRSNSKQGNGAIGLLTDDAIDRTAYYEHAVVMALIPFKNPTLTWHTHDTTTG